MNTTNSKLWAFFVSFVMLVSAFAMVMTSESAEASTGGYDGWGYYYVDNQVPNPMIEYNWIDTTIGGTVIFPHADDDEFGPFRIGFPFVFYGNVFGEFCIGNNGGITFNTQPTCENIWPANDPIPTPGEPDNLIAPFWDDLFEQGEIRYLLQGNAPYRSMVVEWYRVDHISNPTMDDLTFELILYETTNVIRFQYFETFYGDPAIDFGMSATAGIENWDGTVGVQYSLNSPFLFDGVAVEFHPVRGTHYFDDVDVPGTGWTTDGMWHVADESIDPCYGVVGPPPTHPPTAFSSLNAFAYHDDATCNYDTPGLANIGNLTSPPIDLTWAVTARLTFLNWWDSEWGGFYDRKHVQVSTDNVTFNTIYTVDGPDFPSETWNLVAVNLNQYVGGVIWIRFQFDTFDEIGNDMAGWYIDDINMDELIAPWPTNVALFKNMDAWGNPSNEDALNYWGIPYTVYSGADIGVVPLDPYDKVIITSDQDDPFYAGVEGNIPWFEAYVASGGVLEIHAADMGSNSGSWPTGVLPGGYTYLRTGGDNVVMTEPTHTILNYPIVITAAELNGWGASYHGEFPLTPGGSVTILDDGPTILSELVTAPYSGYIVSGQTLEHGLNAGLSRLLENVVLYMPFPVSAADPPVLFNAWVNPWMGNEFTGFNYTVWYSDIDNDAPAAGHPIVHILDSLLVDIPGSPFNMSFDYWLGAPGDYVTGAAYYYNTTLPCPELYNFYMETLDSTGLSYMGPTFPGPDVICGYFPVLTWTGEPSFVADGLNPDWGDAATVFEWRVMYTDLDNEAPEAGHPILTIFENLVPLPGAPFTMNEVDPFDIDYTDGKLYTYSQTLTCGNYYTYGFDANDTAGNTASFLQSVGPQVFCNDAPYFDWTGEPNYVADGLDPETGDPATVFTYRIDFFDNNQHLPAAGEPEVHILDSGIELAGSPISMMEDDPIIWFLQEDFESGSPGWTGTGLWHEVDDSTDQCSLPSIGGAHSWGYHGDAAPPVLPGRECTYDVDDGLGSPVRNWGNLTSPFFDLTTASAATLSFWTWFDTEGGNVYDQKWIRISPDGLVWTNLTQLQGGVDPFEEWFRVEIDLAAFIPGTYQIGFFFDTWDEIANAMRGWFVDDVWVYEGDGNTTDGKRYTLDVLIDCGVSLSYYFTGMDEKGLTAIPTTELFAPTVACGPELDWTGEPNFVSDGLDPQVGDSLTNFEYRIQYRDRNNDAPAAGNPLVHILELGVDIVGSPFAMNPLSWVGAGGDYVAGRRYTYSTTLPVGSDYEYYFYAEDTTALSNQTPTLPGPLVLVGNPPELDWTGEANYLSDGLDPETGDVTTLFEYRIRYSDADDDPPAGGYPIVHILDTGAPIAGSPFAMTWVSWVGAVDDYVAGAVYNFTTTLGVGSDYEYYFYAEDAAALSNQTLTLPGPLVADPGNDPPEATGLLVDSFSPGSAGILHILSATPVFEWGYSDNENQPQTDYWVRVSTTPGATGDMWDFGPAGVSGITTVYAGLPLVDGTDYYFAVRVMDDVQWSLWNETRFHTNAPPPAPTTPVVPADATTIDAGTGTTVSWTSGGADPDGDVVTYHWQVSIDIAFGFVNASGFTAANASDGFPTNTSMTYYWRVNATDGYEFSAYGNTPPAYWTFDTTAVVDNAPEARFPGVGGFLDGTGGILHIISDTPALNWTYNDTEGSPQAEYEVKVGTQSGLGDMWSSGAVAQPDQSVVYAGAQLVDGTDYYFAVRVNDGGKWGAWAEVMFHMNTPPPAPTLDLPADQATDIISGSIDLGWNTVTDAEGDTITYYWYLSEQSDFTPLEDSGNTGSTTDSTTVQPETTYYWKVEAYDGYEFGANSTVFEFTTIADTGSITGTVRDDATNDFIPSAIVELLDSNDDVVDTDTTNVDGEFAFTDLDFGTYSVRVTKSGYNEHLEEDVTIYSGHDENLGIRLTEKVAEEFDWMLIWILLIIIIIIIAVLLILLLKRRKKPEEVPPEEQPPEGYPDQPPQQEPPQQPQPQPEMPPEQPPPAEPQPVEPQPPEPPAESE